MKINLTHLRKRKAEKEKFSVITCYDASFMQAVNLAGIDVILVGDSLGMVIKGYDSTVPVRMSDIVYHTECVARAQNSEHQAFIMADLPFMAYHSTQQTLENAAELMRAGANMVKLEGGAWQAETVTKLADRGIPVCAHLGLTPQSVDKLGGYRIQGRDQAQKDKLFSDAKELEKAGADIVLFECVPSSVTRELTKDLSVPTIGIGAGPDTDAQVLVLYDMLGLGHKHAKFVKNYLTKENIASENAIADALKCYDKEVKSGVYPGPEHQYN